MSQQETITGKLKLIPKLEGESLEDQCKRVYNERYGFADDLSFYSADTWEEKLSDESYKELVIYNGEIYEVISKNNLDCLDLFQMSSNNDGTYDFTLSYYNSGCSFNEAIEYAFDNMEEE